MERRERVVIRFSAKVFGKRSHFHHTAARLCFGYARLDAMTNGPIFKFPSISHLSGSLTFVKRCNSSMPLGHGTCPQRGFYSPKNTTSLSNTSKKYE